MHTLSHAHLLRNMVLIFLFFCSTLKLLMTLYRFRKEMAKEQLVGVLCVFVKCSCMEPIVRLEHFIVLSSTGQCLFDRQVQEGKSCCMTFLVPLLCCVLLSFNLSPSLLFLAIVVYLQGKDLAISLTMTSPPSSFLAPFVSSLSSLAW